MSLNYQVFEHHLVVSDGCKIDTLESCLTNNNDLKYIDEICREDNAWREKNFLFYRNIFMLKYNYYEDVPIELTCPVCEKDYSLGKEELSILKKYYDSADY